MARSSRLGRFTRRDSLLRSPNFIHSEENPLNLKHTALVIAIALPTLAVVAQPRQPETVPAAPQK